MTSARVRVAARFVGLPFVVAGLLVAAHVSARATGWELGTLPVVAIGVAFGIDYGMYLLGGVRKVAAGGASLADAIDGAISGSGRKMAVTALSMTAVAACCTLTQLRFAAEITILLALWMAASALTALIVLPVMLRTLGPAPLASSVEVPSRRRRASRAR
jgi:hypothetical protein